FEPKERLAMVEEAITPYKSVAVEWLDGLLVNYADKQGACAIIRGLRAVSDFEFEFQLALMNRKLNERVETIFMMPRETYTFLSSRMIKEVARLGGDISAFVPPHVETALRDKMAGKKRPAAGPNNPNAQV